MSLDPRTPVLIGVGQHVQRTDQGEPDLEPVEMMATAVRNALDDTGVDASSVLDRVDAVKTVALLSWRYQNPGRFLLDRLGVDRDVPSEVTGYSGSSPQMLVNRAANQIQSGELDCVLLSGAESWRTRQNHRREGTKPDWSSEPEGVEPAAPLDAELDMSHAAEISQGVVMPIQVYPMMEHAHRAALGRSIDEHLPKVAALWARFSEVAAGNPYAWTRQAMTPDEILDTSGENRQISNPYPKVMVSNDLVEQSAALLLCSVEVAEALGVDRSKWVFPLVGVDTKDTKYISNRQTLAEAPAVGVAGRHLFELGQTSPDQIEHVDLYSCFPSAVQIGAAQLGFDLDRQLTVTGGLRFAGGPWNNYVMHAIATMVGVLRDDPGTTGLCWANGGFMTKHALGLYSTEPREGGFAYANPQDEVDALPTRELAEDHDGPATVETWTVMYDRDGSPQQALFALLTEDGARAWGSSTEADVVKAAHAEDLIGRQVQRAGDGAVTLLP